MVGRASRRRKVSINHQRCWLWGRHAVLETLAAGRWPILELCLANELPEAERLTAEELAHKHNVLLRYDDRERISKLCPREDHQGYLARMPPFPYAELPSLFSQQPTLLLVLDAIQDPYNFGAILRSAEVFGAAGVCIGTGRQAEVSSQVARSSAGAVNRVPIVRTELSAILSSVRNAGMLLVGGSEKGATSIAAFNFRRPVAIVIGNEGVGLSPEIQSCCDALVRIPQQGAINSLNAAAAAAVICYEVRRQRG